MSNEWIWDVAGLVATVFVPVGGAYAVQVMKSVVHNNDVQLYMEAGINAAGRVILGATKGLQGGQITAENVGKYVSEAARKEAVQITTDMLPKVTSKLNKSVDDVTKMVEGKIGNQIDKLTIAPSPESVTNIFNSTKPGE